MKKHKHKWTWFNFGVWWCKCGCLRTSTHLNRYVYHKPTFNNAKGDE